MIGKYNQTEQRTPTERGSIIAKYLKGAKSTHVPPTQIYKTLSKQRTIYLTTSIPKMTLLTD
jgi:hypothetical protein